MHWMNNLWEKIILITLLISATLIMLAVGGIGIAVLIKVYKTYG